MNTTHPLLNHLLALVPINVCSTACQWQQSQKMQHKIGSHICFLLALEGQKQPLDVFSVTRTLDNLQVQMFTRNWKGSFGLTRGSNLLFNLGPLLAWFLHHSKSAANRTLVKLSQKLGLMKGLFGSRLTCLLFNGYWLMRISLASLQTLSQIGWYLVR